mmetsp:Transcript_895/g.1403  ORF Transcript_895/g.1403 Transcript_895/m.1403 type:complete len:336 (+) Transcript_895:40-1047(+)
MVNQKIKKQLEFYFGNANLPKDTHLRGLVAQDNDGYVEINRLCSFNRMQQLGATVENIAEAAEANPEMFQVSHDKTRVRRIKPLPEIDDSIERTVVVKTYPLETLLSDLESEYDGKYQTESIRLIRKIPKELIVKSNEQKKNGEKPEPLTRSFNGTVHIMLKSVDEAKRFENEVKTYKDTPLSTIILRQHLQNKKEERQQRKRKRDEEKIRDEVNERIKLMEGTLFTVELPPSQEPWNFATTKNMFGTILGVERPKIYVDISEDAKSAVVRVAAVDLLEKFVTLKDNMKFNEHILKVVPITDAEELRKAAVAYVKSSNQKGNNRPNKKKRFNRRN